MNTQLKETLRSLGPLTPEQIQLLRDMQGWIEYSIANGFSLKSVVGVLAHDANGVLYDVPAFRPQVAGYGKYRTEVEDLSALADQKNPNDE